MGEVHEFLSDYAVVRNKLLGRVFWLRQLVVTVQALERAEAEAYRPLKDPNFSSLLRDYSRELNTFTEAVSLREDPQAPIESIAMLLRYINYFEYTFIALLPSIEACFFNYSPELMKQSWQNGVDSAVSLGIEAKYSFPDQAVNVAELLRQKIVGHLYLSKFDPTRGGLGDYVVRRACPDEWSIETYVCPHRFLKFDQPQQFLLPLGTNVAYAKLPTFEAFSFVCKLEASRVAGFVWATSAPVEYFRHEHYSVPDARGPQRSTSHVEMRYCLDQMECQKK